MAKAVKAKPVPDFPPDPAIAIAEEYLDIVEAMERAQVRELSKRKDKLRETLLALSQGRNSPIEARGKHIFFEPKKVAGYTVADMTQYHIRIVPIPAT